MARRTGAEQRHDEAGVEVLSVGHGPHDGHDHQSVDVYVGAAQGGGHVGGAEDGQEAEADPYIGPGEREERERGKGERRTRRGGREEEGEKEGKGGEEVRRTTSTEKTQRLLSAVQRTREKEPGSQGGCRA